MSKILVEKVRRIIERFGELSKFTPWTTNVSNGRIYLIDTVWCFHQSHWPGRRERRFLFTADVIEGEFSNWRAPFLLFPAQITVLPHPIVQDFSRTDSTVADEDVVDVHFLLPKCFRRQLLLQVYPQLGAPQPRLRRKRLLLV